MRCTNFVGTTVAACALFAATAEAQQHRTPTLIGESAAIGGYGTMEMLTGNIKGKTGLFAGGHLAVLIDHRVAVGFGGTALVSDNATIDTGTGARDLAFAYGGLVLGYVLRANAVLHPRFDLLVAGGSVGADELDGTDSDRVFVLEPGAGIELSVSKAIRLSLSATYRHVADVELTGARAADLRGLSGQLTLRVGKF